jgi:hypothetical protein
LSSLRPVTSRGCMNVTQKPRSSFTIDASSISEVQKSTTGSE